MAGGPDVVVVGGRVSGCLTAVKLAERGVSVRLLEAHSLPSDTTSTHFFRGEGLVGSLKEIGVLDEVLSTGAPPLGCQYFSVDGGPFEQQAAQDPGSIGYCLSVRRSTLDAILARRAVAIGVDVRLRTRVVDVVSRDGVIIGVVDDSGTTHLAQVIVGADGRRSTVARLLAATVEERHAPARAMHYRYAIGWQSPDPVGPEFLLAGPDLCYVFPSDAGVACLAVSTPVTSHRLNRGDAAESLEQAFRANPQTCVRFDRVEWVSAVYTGFPADSVWRAACGPGWALVGDAGTAQDPWAGLGMDTAARQAEAFVEAFHAGDYVTAYPQLRHERTYAAFEETARLAPDLRRLLVA